ncbi:MAG: DUF3592 domain-containing protein [Hydrogenophilus sp.]
MARQLVFEPPLHPTACDQEGQAFERLRRRMLEQIDQMRQKNFGAVADVEDEMHGGDKRGDLDFATKRKYNVTVSDAFEIGVKESLMIQPGLRRTKSKILDFFLLLFVIVGSVLIAYGGQQLWIAYQAESWPQTVGTVIASSVDYHRSRNSASYFPRVRYRYRVPIRGRSIAKQRGVSFWFSPRCGFC